MPESTPNTMCAWISPGQIPLLDAMRAALGITIQTVGCEGRSGESAQASKALGAAPCASFRDFSHLCAGKLVFLGELPGEASDAIPELLARADRVFTLEPIPDSVRSHSMDTNHETMNNLHFLPLLRNTRGFGAAMETIETSSAPRVVSLTGTSPPNCGSLGARLVDAMDAVRTLLGEPETIDASIHGPRQGGLEVPPGDSLRSLQGELTAHIHCIDGSTATLTLSDRGGSWVRELTALGDGGMMRITEQQFAWTSPDGTDIEQLETTNPVHKPDFARSVIDAVRRILDVHAPASRPIDMRRVLAMSEAALLSARTRQPESPATVLQMIGAG